MMGRFGKNQKKRGPSTLTFSGGWTKWMKTVTQTARAVMIAALEPLKDVDIFDPFQNIPVTLKIIQIYYKI